MSDALKETPAASFTAAWLDEQIAAQTVTVELCNAAVTATDVYQRLQQEVGVLNWLKLKRAALGNGQEQ